MGEPISGPLLCKKALLLNQKMSGNSDFKASTGWLRIFKSRHEIKELHIESETLPGDSIATNEFIKKIPVFWKKKDKPETMFTILTKQE